MEHLIPHEWFVESPSVLLIVIAIAGLYFLQLGADWLVEGASAIGYRLGIPEVIVGATIVSLGTTAPECAVSVLAAFSGNPGLALGNAVGSVIADTALIFGLGCLIVTLPADKYVLSRQGWVQIGSAVFLACLCYGSYMAFGDDATITRVMGFILLGLLICYLYFSVVWSKNHPQEMAIRVSDEIAEHAEPGEEIKIISEETKHVPLWKEILFGIFGLVIVIFAGHITIEAVTELAVRIGIPQVVIAATLVAFGTSLPELVVGFTAIRKGHAELLVGNVLGADILNILFVTGAAASASPLPIIDTTAKLPEIFLVIHLPAMLIILTYFRVCIFSATKTGQFQRWMGLPLVLMYVAYATIQFVVSM